jgi:hypothetical protein
MLKLSKKSLAVSALFALTLTAGASRATAESGIIVKEASSDGTYCHIKYMALSEEALSSDTVEFNPSDVVDSYGPCSFDPKSPEARQQQLTAKTRHGGVFNDGGNDGGGD